MCGVGTFKAHFFYVRQLRKKNTFQMLVCDLLSS